INISLEQGTTLQMKDKTSDLSRQIDEVKEIMKKNLEDLLRREENLNNLMEVSEYLKDRAYNFRRTTENVSRSYWWKNVKNYSNILWTPLNFVQILSIIHIVVPSIGLTPALHATAMIQ
uniref:V-SNARE coiled-coil homology domain-containing protein n=1 Tax=Xiphophorus couchianus TaxID=32473 RepID=A0A3B5LQA3_9TELE